MVALAVIRIAAIGWAIACPSLAPARADPKSEGFKLMQGEQIRQAFAGHTFSDDTHFAFRYLAGGTVEGAGMGKKVSRKWEVRDDTLCVTDSSGELCYSVWKKGPAVKLTFGGSDLVLDGFVR